MSYHYSIVQWIFLFYFYCFFGWCFESVYVSLKTKKWTNRGFMRGPFLPLYGSGAIMMLLVSMPFQESIPLTYVAGCIGATALEYVTGVTMEALFKVRYWDYSSQKFNYKGHICLKSTLAWGGLTILMTHVLQQQVERVVFLIPEQALTVITFLLTAVIFTDFAFSFRAALDLRDILIRLEEAKIELGHLQMRVDVLIALTEEEVEHRVAEYREELKAKRQGISEKVSERKDEIAQAVQSLLQEFGDVVELPGGRIREAVQEKLKTAQKEIRTRRKDIVGGMEKRLRKIFLGNPSIHSDVYGETLEELQRELKK